MNKLIAIDQKTGKPYKFSAPENFNEFTEQQLVAWAALCLKKLNVDDLVRAVMIIFYRIPFDLFKKIPDSQKVQLAPTLRFLFGKNTLTRWIIKELSIWSLFKGTQKLYGPDDRLANCTIAEYRALELYYQAFERLKVKGEREKANDFLDLLIATLYRPKRKGVIDNDIREPMSEHAVMQRAKRMRSLSRKMRHAILLNYEGIRLFIRENYLDNLPKGKATAGDGLFDFNGIILSVAGSKFGTKAETEKALLYDFLNHVVITSEALELEQKRIQSKLR
ncbi:hypothetical protein ACFSJU_14755 [Paradesertivirga mongoliensis]|uniref:Uncharacterized protein n=1 Tax=Paradesertivirga mongoliensis TaxID=2100740 RepID=A0ABW4ZP83_9SPHI|nr:hypothetical protein [Pedobacter mongoliensis]